MKILFVDDEESFLEQAKIFLEKEDDRLNIETALSAPEALDMLNDNEYDAIVSDYQMPEMDGLEFLEIVREERNYDIPFIVFTGKGREEVAMESLNLGADWYLRKGGDPQSQYGILAKAIVQEVKHRESERRREEMEEERKKTAKRSEFLHSLLRHDLRNKAQEIRGFLELLGDTELSDKQRKFLNEAMESVEEGLRLVDKVKSLKEIDREEGARPVNLGAILDTVINKYETRAEEKEMKIKYEGTDVKVRAGNLIEEVFSNIIRNAIQHSAGDLIRIVSETTNGNVLITIEDNGEGISDEYKELIFQEPWLRDKKDSGLGLYLVSKIVENYGGKIKVKDSELGGTRLDVILESVGD